MSAWRNTRVPIPASSSSVVSSNASLRQLARSYKSPDPPNSVSASTPPYQQRFHSPAFSFSTPTPQHPARDRPLNTFASEYRTPNCVANMSTSTMPATHGHNEACCNIPPVVSTGYSPKGAYEELGGYKSCKSRPSVSVF